MANIHFGVKEAWGQTVGYSAFHDLEYVNTLFCFLILRMGVTTPALQSGRND